MTKTYTWILFDVGNVLIEHNGDGDAALAAAVGTAASSVHSFTHESGLQHKANTGRVTPQQYTDSINTRFGSALTPQDIVHICAPYGTTPKQGMQNILTVLHPTYRLGVFSDTNFTHWENFKKLRFAQQFDCLIASHELGLMKCEEGAFVAALKRLDAQPREVLFLDDGTANVECARSAGLDAFCVSTSEEVLGVLKSTTAI